jgi:predicted nucleic acid-binding protein
MGKMIERLLDSVIVIDHLNGIEKATKYISDIDSEKSAISVITRAEILVGLDVAERDVVKSLLDQYHTFIIDKSIADIAADLRREFGWKLPDAFQAAISIQNNIKLVTRNSKDFDPIKHAFVEIPYQI